MPTSRLSAALRSLKPFKKHEQAESMPSYQELDSPRNDVSSRRSLSRTSGIRSGESQYIFGLELLANSVSTPLPSGTSDPLHKKQALDPGLRTPRTPHRNIIRELPTEVLQQIFSHLDLITLLKCRCVCKLWDSCIPGDSPELREAMFLPANSIFKATEWPPLSLFFEIYTDAETARRFSAVPPVRVGAIDKVVLSHVSRTSVALHPFIAQIDRYLVPGVPQLQTQRSRHREPEDFHFTHLKNKAGVLLPSAHVGSLADMLVSMRPVTELHIHFRYMDTAFKEIGTRQNMRQCILSNKEGVTLVHVFRIIETQIMGLLRDETLRQISEMPVPSRETKGLREKLLYIACPIKGKMTFVRN